MMHTDMRSDYAFRAKMTILADDEGSWPTQVRKSFEDNLKVFEGQLAWERELDERYEQGDISARWNPTPNLFRATQEQILDQIEIELQAHRLVGYHCCRLLDFEVDDIRTRGMEVLSPELVARKVGTALEHGYITKEQATALQSEALVKEETGRRNGMIWFLFSRSMLRTEGHGLYLLLGQWGGEAIYVPHDRTELGRHLGTLGKATIVEAEVSVPNLQVFTRVADRLLRVFLWRRGIELPHEHTFEGHSKVAIPASMIREIYTDGSLAFEALTEYSKWDR